MSAQHTLSDWPVWQAFLRASPRLREMTDEQVQAAVAKARGDREFVDHDTMMAHIAAMAAAEAGKADR